MSTGTHPPLPPPSNPKPIPPPPTTTTTIAAPPPTAIKPPPTAVKVQIREPNNRLPSYVPKSAQEKKRPLDITTRTPAPTRRTCCCCLTWLLITLLLLSVAVGATCGVFWILYRPQRPKFTIASLKLSNLTLTGNLDTDASGRLYTSGNLTISAKNPNSKLAALYDGVSMSVYSNRSNVLIANSTFPPFKSDPGNSTVMRFVFRNWRTLDLDAARGLRSELEIGRKSVIGSRLELETRLGVRIGKWKTRKIGIRVTCFGLRVRVPVKKGSSAAKVSESDDGKCEVDIRYEIGGFTF